MSTQRIEDSYAPVPLGDTSTAGDYVATMHGVLDAIPVDAVIALARQIFAATIDGHTVYAFGNGGSAATAEHIACDLSKNTQVRGAPPVRCLSLSSMIATTSALANDISYSRVFAEVLQIWGHPGDLALAVSTSGNSPNVLEGLAAARELGMHTAGLLGFRGGAAFDMVDIPVLVRSESIPHLEDAHNIVNHILTNSLRSFLLAHVAERLNGRPAIVQWHEVAMKEPPLLKTSPWEDATVSPEENSECPLDVVLERI